DVGPTPLDESAHRRRPAADRDVAVNRWFGRGDHLMLGYAHAADSTSRTGDLDSRLDSLVETDALEHRMSTEPAGQLLDPLNRLLAALRDDIGRSELARERDPVRVPAEENDLLSAEALG